MMAADYRHIGGVENRLGRHYSRFSPFWPAASFADQSLALRKSWNAGSNRRSQVSVFGMIGFLTAWSSFVSVVVCAHSLCCVWSATLPPLSVKVRVENSPCFGEKDSA